MITADGRVLDRLIPKDWRHVERHPLSTASRPELHETPAVVERILNIPRQYRDEYDQGTEGACVGFSQSWMMSVLNRQLYDALRLYIAAQQLDEWVSTPPDAGTSLRAGFDVLRQVGHWRIYAGKSRAPHLVHGIESNKWAQTVDEVRASIAAGIPVNIGINWYARFSRPIEKPRLDDVGRPVIQFGRPRFDYWIGLGDVSTWGRIDGGHAITIAGASDLRQAFALLNTWGESYPFLVWLPYVAFMTLLRQDGEAGLIVDRPERLAA